jgi:hypothetical protein
MLSDGRIFDMFSKGRLDAGSDAEYWNRRERIAGIELRAVCRSLGEGDGLLIDDVVEAIDGVFIS